jgi:lysyl-tRNA synthetase class 2
MEAHLHAPAVGDAFLHTSPEFALKRVLAAGLPRIYAICPCFREEERGPLHTQEFTMVEWYRAGCGYRESLQDTLALIQNAAAALGSTLGPAQQLSYAECFERFAGTSMPADPIEQQRIWVNDIEPQLKPLTVVSNYPAADAAFAQIRGSIAERFEVFYKGVELANAFSELLDSQELLSRWQANNALREAEGRPPHPIDERLIEAVSRHPRASGVAMGLDRLLYVLLDLKDIREGQVLG